MDTNKTLALAITKALGYAENGGKPNVQNPKKGKSGEMKSVFQYTPDTWKAVAQKYLKNAKAPLNADNETYVTSQRVYDWLKKGYTPEQIFSMHNAGQGEPDAYEGHFSDGTSSTGVNKYGVHFDVPTYVKTGMKYLQEFEPGITNEVAQSKSPQVPTQPQMPFAHSNIPPIINGQQAQPQSGGQGLVAGLIKEITGQPSVSYQRGNGV